jgi:hypothetical protein
VEPEELAGTVGMVVVLVEAAVQAWAWAWGLATELAWVLALEQEELDCHNRHCFGKQSLRHCRKLDRFRHPGSHRKMTHHPICSSSKSQLMPV